MFGIYEDVYIVNDPIYSGLPEANRDIETQWFLVAWLGSQCQVLAIEYLCILKSSRELIPLPTSAGNARLSAIKTVCISDRAAYKPANLQPSSPLLLLASLRETRHVPSARGG